MRYRVIALAVTLMIVLGLQPAAHAQSDSITASSAAASPKSKIHPHLLEDIDKAFQVTTGNRLNRAARPASIQFMARVSATTDLTSYAPLSFKRPFADPTGNTVVVGQASATALLKIAELPGVVALQRPESLVTPPDPSDQEIALNSTIQPRLANTSESAGPAPTGWYDVTTAVHGSNAAWAKGFTGAGVRYMSNDSGADYCHPDLSGTWAYIDDPASPYYGLPQMFDSWSSYIAAYDYNLGTNYIASGLADYADTSTVVSGATAVYQPLDASVAHTYKLPGTSKSGQYHIGSHPDKGLALNAQILSGAFGDGTAAESERAAILVVDAVTAGVYDTVYVDLNYNFDFSDDTPARLDRSFQNHETACLDYTRDGLNDISGGLVYFISDGVTAVPTLDWYWGIPGQAYGNGDLVAFIVNDFTEGGGDHGQGTTSSAVGQGRVRGSLENGPDGPPQAEGKGLVVGPGKDVKSTQNGDFYMTPFGEDAFIYAGLGYDGIKGTSDDIQIVSNSWGMSNIDNDGLDYESRLYEVINRAFAPNTTLLWATGNGGPGYGTATSPKPSTAIAVGASTLFGETGNFEPIASAKQINSGDPMSWSDRGPGALPSAGVDVVATGAFGAGAIPLNSILNGAVATSNFGGTSQATPIAAGNLALIYQAWKSRTGSWPTFAEARALLMSSAKDTKHDVFSQGSGLVNADLGTDIASGRFGLYATPPSWSAGDYNGVHYSAFPNIISPGDGSRFRFVLTNPTDKPINVQLNGIHMKEITTRSTTIRTKDVSLDHGTTTVPDYIYRIDGSIPAGTDLLQARLTKPYDQFDPDDDQDPDSGNSFSNWRLLLYNWTDLNKNGKYWIDSNGDGKVSVSEDAEGNLTSEMDPDEYNRMSYGYNWGPTQQARISNPLERKASGILLGLQHSGRIAAVPQSDLTIELSYWKQNRWYWLTFEKSGVLIPPGRSVTVSSLLAVPSNAAYGMYEGAVTASYRNAAGTKEVLTIPVSVAVAAKGTNFSFGGSTNHLLYDNAQVFGYTDYSWRDESGDTRFFWTNIRERDLPSSGVPYLVVDNSWQGKKTDIDTTVLGPTEDCFSNGIDCPALLSNFPGAPSIFGPYSLETVGRSERTYVGDGRWKWQTSSGGTREMIAAPVTAGLHSIQLHQVKVDGTQLNEPFRGQTGLVTLSTDTIEATGVTGTASISLKSQLALGAFQAAGFGLSTPSVITGTVQQDDPNSPISASFVKTIELKDAARLTVSTSNAAGNDLDLYILGPDNTLVGSSTTATADEEVTLQRPADGTYTILVHGYSVPTGSTTFDLTIDAVQGANLQVTGAPNAIPANGTGTLTVGWDLTGKPSGTYQGLVLFGPAEAPSLFSVPVTVVVP